MNQVGEEQEKFHLKENIFLSCKVICIYLGQSFPQTLSLPNGEWNEMIISPHLPLLVQEPLRPEGLPVAPVLAFEELGKQGLRQETGLVQSPSTMTRDQTWMRVRAGMVMPLTVMSRSEVCWTPLGTMLAYLCISIRTACESLIANLLQYFYSQTSV